MPSEAECTPVAATPGACSAGRPERQPFQRIPGGSSVVFPCTHIGKREGKPAQSVPVPKQRPILPVCSGLPRNPFEGAPGRPCDRPGGFSGPLNPLTVLEHDRYLAAARQGRGDRIFWDERFGHADAANHSSIRSFVSSSSIKPAHTAGNRFWAIMFTGPRQWRLPGPLPRGSAAYPGQPFNRLKPAMVRCQYCRSPLKGDDLRQYFN